MSEKNGNLSGESEQGEALLPCPFCGSPAARHLSNGRWARCSNHNCAAYQFVQIEIWNYRVPSSTVAGAQEKKTLSDTVRLDWLIKQCGYTHFETKRKMIEFIYDTEGFNMNARQAIDKAMASVSDATGAQPLGEKET